jgi:hypothetical protein
MKRLPDLTFVAIADFHWAARKKKSLSFDSLSPNFVFPRF